MKYNFRFTGFTPVASTLQSAAYDIKANESVMLVSGKVTYVKTGIFWSPKSEDNKTVVGLIFPRSSLATKHGVILANAVGVIDMDYKDEWLVPLTVVEGRGRSSYTINKGDRIAQVMFQFVESNIEGLERVEDTREGGFGSTDKMTTEKFLQDVVFGGL